MISRNVIYIILLQFQINIIKGFSVTKIKDLAEKYITSAILNLIKESSGSNQHLTEDPLNIKGGINGKFFEKNIEAKLFNKIPHRYEMPFYEYNEKFRNLHRPLMRVLVKKPESESNIQEPAYKNNQNKYLILIIKIKGSLNKNSRKEFLYADKKVFDMAKKKKLNDLFKIGHKRLSRKIYTKSAEIQDPLIPGYLLDIKTTTPLPKKWLPHYPYWNYWTYDKTLHNDHCPEDFLEMNGQCIEIPPH